MERQQKLDKAKKSIFLFGAIVVSLLFLYANAFAAVPTQASPNYLIILVHGINSTHRAFMGHGENGSDVSAIPEDKQEPWGDLKGYLENELGLKGYVYAYTFSWRDGHILTSGHELGDPDWNNQAAFIGGKLYHNAAGNEIGPDETGIKSGNSWFEQARADFKGWYAKEVLKKPGRIDLVSEDVIPDQYIIIAHSLGGLCSRAYLSSEFYQDDVAVLITIDSQHLGSNSARALKRIYEFYENDEDVAAMAQFIGLTLAALWAHQDDVAKYFAFGGYALVIGRTAVDEFAIKGMLGWYPSQPAVQDVDSGGSFMRELSSKDFVKGNPPLKVRFISGDGIPSPSGDIALNRYILGLSAVQTLLSSEYLNELPLGAKLMALYLSETSGAIFNRNGDIYAPKDSQEGKGLAALNSPNIDFKNYSYRFGDDYDILADALIGVSGATALIDAIMFLPEPAKILMKFATYHGVAATVVAAGGFKLRLDTYLSGHGLILKEVYEQKLIDKALDGIIPVGGSAASVPASSISASSVNSPTASYSAPQQTFALLSNLDSNNSQVSDYHTLTIEAFTEGTGDRTQLFPIEIDGQKQWISAVTIKEAPTALKGVINTFLPKRLKQFQYSENFAAWKDVGEVDEWGNFTIRDLNLAEGQNVIAFRAESWTGNKSNQHLKIILNTIPQFVSQPEPEPNSATANVRQKIRVEANKACYTADPSEKIQVVSFQVDGAEKLAEATITPSQETHRAQTIAEWTPSDPLSEGQHDVLVRFQSNVGVSQAIWSFVVDTTAPVVSVSTLEPYSARDPTGEKMTIKYQTSDNHSAFLNNLSVRLYRGTEPDENSNFITEITSISTQAAGEQFVTWDGKDANGNPVEDGIYSIRVKAFDQAGNWSSATGLVSIDSTPPGVVEAHVSPNPMTGLASEFGFAGKITEKSMVVLKLTNLSDNQSTAYLAQSSVASDDGSGLSDVSYTWRFDDPFAPSLRDGTYKLEITARDEAGNESEPYVVENIRIDRTPPVIFSQYADPFVLANSGTSPYQTNLRYRLSESNDASGNKQPESEPATVKIKLFDENSGELLWMQNAAGSLAGENELFWDASDPSIGKGSYKFQITAYDDVGNFSTAYATCVKDGVAPVISYPFSNAEVSGTVALRGTAMDPDWTNNLGFKEYRVYYQSGEHTATVNPGPEWKTDLVEVPEIYRTAGTAAQNVSVKAVQNDATLAYFYTDSLADGRYTILLIAEEEGGAKFASARTITASNSNLAAGAVNPTIAFSDLPAGIDFDGDNTLPISFTYGGKEINAYVEILKITDNGTRETVFYKYFPKLSADFYTGAPAYQSGNELGYFIWQDEAGWHVRWNGKSGENHRFNGSLVAAGAITDFNAIGSGVSQMSSIINWERDMGAEEGGFDLKTDSAQLIITSYIDNDPSTYEDDFSTLAVPFFGIAKYQPAYSPVIITGLTGQTGSTGKTIEWDGKTETGAFVDNGDYVVRVRAEGADGTGLTVVEKNLSVNTPFELTNIQTSATSFNPVGLPDRITVSYNLSKDALIQLKVYPAGGSSPLAVIDDGIQLGKINPDFPHTISWRGNYPDKNGAQVVTSGDYVLKLAATAVDGSQTIEEEITPSIRVESLGTSSLVRLDPIGEEVNFNGGTVRAAQGDSDYFWEAKATGTYYPPINYNFTLGLQGHQHASVYPYVPFAGIMHRGFNRIFGKVKVKFKLYCYRPSVNIFGEVVGQAHSILNRESELSFFEMIEGKPEYELIFPFVASELGWQGITKVEVSVLFNSSSGFLLDDMNDEYKEAPWNTLASYSSSRGVFNIKAKRTYEDAYFNEKCQVHLFVSPASDIEYSRLTNRFVPWFGFINVSHPSAEAFSNMNRYLSKLGFPGKDYFEDPNKAIAVYKTEVAGSYEADIYDPGAYLTDGKLSRSALESKTRSTMSGDTSLGAQDSYLSDEYIEFIPITEPDHGAFNFEPAIVENETGSGVSKRYELKKRLSSYPIEAKTDYVKPYSTSGIEIKWPNNLTEINDKNNQQLACLAELKQNPQDYNIENTAYEINTDELRSRQNDYLAQNPELSLEEGWFKRSGAELSGILRYSEDLGKYYREFEEGPGGMIDPPDYVTDYTYSVFEKNPSDLNFSFDPHSQAGALQISTSRAGEPWSTSDDPALLSSGGVVKGGPETFNADGFRADGRSLPIYFKDAYQSAPAAPGEKALFRKEGENVIGNPDLAIDDWQVTLKDAAGEVNQDLEIKDGDTHDDYADSTRHYFQAKLKYAAKERRLVKLTGHADSNYELMYFNGDKWVKFAQGAPDAGGNFVSLWDVGRLCGKHTVLLKTSNCIDSQDVYVGDTVYYGLDTPENKWVTSAYKRAELQFKPDSFNQDEFSSVTPVSMTEIYVRNKPIIMTHGPVVELQPSPINFDSESRPFLRFLYSTDDLKEGYGITVLPNDPDWKAKTKDLTIHQVTAIGDLQVVDDQKKYLETDSVTGLPYFAFESALDHFSTYTLLNGKFSLSAPIVYADRYVTNQDTVTIYGTAEHGSILTIYVKNEPIPPDPAKAEGHFGRLSADAETGGYRFENVKLLQEGENYIYVTSHLPDSPDIRTYSEVAVVKDTVAPLVEAKPNLYAFSPNGDGKYDSLDYAVKTNEEGKVYLSVVGQQTAVGGQLFNEEISAEPEKEYRINWAESSVRIYKTGTATGWSQIEERTLPSAYADGEYIATVYAIDEAGNISENIINRTIVDTSPPSILGINADPNPFTPNGDGVKDTTSFSYRLSEPAYVTTSIYREGGDLFRRNEGPTENFSYPTLNLTGRQADRSTGEWVWDGRGSRNELIGGEYTYSFTAEDWVGNSVTSEIKTIMVDREPSLIPYAYADPDPFAPVNPDNSFTEIKYYLSRDNLKVSVGVINNEGEYIKTLFYEELQSKGEHSVRWYGDYDSGYGGAKAAKNQYRVGDGSYQFKIYVEAPDIDRPAGITNTVLVDNIPPAIVAGPVMVDYPAGKATMAYSIPENSTIDAGVYSEDGSLVATLKTAQAELPGENTLTYDFGGDSAGGDALKYFKIVAVDRAKNSAEEISEAFEVNPNKFQIMDVQAVPGTFTPNGDGLTDLTRISYRILGGEPDYSVSVNILTETGATVKRLVNSEPQSPGAYSFYWDGRNDSSQLAADGHYQYEIVAEDKLGSRVEGRGMLLLVSTSPIVDVSAGPTPFSPNGDGYLDTITFNYSLDYPVAYETGEALVKLEVFDSTGEAVWNRIFNNTPGSYTYEWDGKDGEGRTVDSGQYYVKASAEDPFHALAVPKTAYFEVDNTLPEVQVDADMIVNPWSFSTNANPDGSDPRSSNFYYTLVEESKVSVKVYDVPDDQTTYSKADFNSGNLVATLVDNVWQSGGAQRAVSWDGSTAGGYAEPGKYAFVVETVDKVGNPAEKLWGGTVWIQNNVLILREPDQQEHAGQNPDPSRISPDGNSADPAQRRARFYFMIDLSLNPAEIDAPERIEAAAVIAHTKAVGNYSVKVYGDSGLSNLVRTIVSDATAESATLTWEDWDGRDDNGQFVADGTYYMAVDVKDYLGDPAVNNLLAKPVTVDNTVPVVSNLSAAPYYFSPGATGSTIKDTSLTYEVSDNSGRAQVTIDVFKNATPVKTLAGGVWKDNGTYYQVWDGGGQTGFVGTMNESGFDDGVYTFKVSAIDEAGNSAEVKVKDVMVDTLDPTFGANPESRDWAAADISVEAAVSGSVSGIKTSQYAWSDNLSTPSGGWIDFTSGEVIAGNENGEWYLHFKGEDNAGNSSTTYFGLYKKDDVSPEVSASPISRAWATTAISVTLGVSDAHSGVATSQYAWSTGTATPGSGWNNYFDSQVVSQSLDGTWYLHLRATDNAGNPVSVYYGPYRKDNTSPVVGASPISRPWASGNISVAVTASDAHSGINYSQYAWSADTSTPSGGWVNYSSGQSVTQTSEGTWYLHLKAEDNVGLTVNTYKGPYRKDSVPPVIGNLLPKSFNPYTEGNVTVNFNVFDPAPSSGFSVSNISAKIKYGAIDIRELTVYDDGGGNYRVVWDGKNNNTHYVNEGNYTLEIAVADAIGNAAQKTGSIQLVDDIQLSDNWRATDNVDTVNPDISFSSGKYHVVWNGNQSVGGLQNIYYRNSTDGVNWGTETEVTQNLSVYNYEFPSIAADGQNVHLAWSLRNDGNEKDLYLFYKKSTDGGDSWGSNIWLQHSPASFPKYPRIAASGNNVYVVWHEHFPNSMYEVWVHKSSDGGSNWSKTRLTNNGDKSWYPDVAASGSSVHVVWGETSTVFPMSTQIKHQKSTDGGATWGGIQQVQSTLLLEAKTAIDISGSHLYAVAEDIMGTCYSRSTDEGASWTVSDIVPAAVFWGMSIAASGNVVHVAWVADGVYYTRSTDNGNTWSSPVKISSGSEIGQTRIAADGSKAFIVWSDRFHGVSLNYRPIVIYGQYIPEDFAPIEGTVTAAKAIPVGQPSTQSATLEAPTLVAPEDASQVNSLRPTFTWRHHKADTQEYKIDLDKYDTFDSVYYQTFSKSPNTGSPDKDDPTLYHYTYSIHEFDPGLDRDTYYWKVTAVGTAEAATSEVWSFTVAPELTLTGVTNYPNPFNPNRESTKIRYRLGADADEVRIRIYDVVGSLVTELDGSVNGEGSSIWNKYNDVEWNGRNGRGDLVVNGIYPFEIIARLGGKSVSGRGKIAVLK